MTAGHLANTFILSKLTEKFNLYLKTCEYVYCGYFQNQNMFVDCQKGKTEEICRKANTFHSTVGTCSLALKVTEVWVSQNKLLPQRPNPG